MSPCQDETVGVASKVQFKRDLSLFKDKQGVVWYPFFCTTVCSANQCFTVGGWEKEVVLAHSVGCDTITVLKNVFVICVVLACSSKKSKNKNQYDCWCQKAAVVISLKHNASFMRPVSSSHWISLELRCLLRNFQIPLSMYLVFNNW